MSNISLGWQRLEPLMMWFRQQWMRLNCSSPYCRSYNHLRPHWVRPYKHQGFRCKSPNGSHASPPLPQHLQVKESTKKIVTRYSWIDQLIDFVQDAKDDIMSLFFFSFQSKKQQRPTFYGHRGTLSDQWTGECIGGATCIITVDCVGHGAALQAVVVGTIQITVWRTLVALDRFT